MKNVRRCIACGCPCWDGEAMELTRDETFYADLPDGAVVCVYCYCELVGDALQEVA